MPRAVAQPPDSEKRPYAVTYRKRGDKPGGVRVVGLTDQQLARFQRAVRHPHSRVAKVEPAPEPEEK